MRVLPAMAGRLTGFAVRVPTPNVSLVDLVVALDADPEHPTGQALCLKGKVYRLEPRRLVRITGQEPFKAWVYLLAQLRCNLCGELFAAQPPAGAEQLELLGLNDTFLGQPQTAQMNAQAFALLGESTLDVYLNAHAYWRSVPERVWEYTLGGYQVIKKWLSYREEPLLGRRLKIDEVREVSAMARRIAAILLLEPALDAHYAGVKQATFTLAEPATAR